MKKILLSIITSFLIVTTMPCYSVIAESQETVEAKNLKLSPEVIAEIKKLDAENNTGFINGIQSVIGVVGRVGSVFTAYNSIYNFLKSVGVIESPEQATQKAILNKLTDLQDYILDMNEKLDGIVEELDRNFAEIDLDFDDVKVRLDEQNINSFTTNYENKMVDRLSDFENTLKSKIKTWYQNTKQEIELPISYKKTKSEILISDDNIETIINETNLDKNKYINIKIDDTLLNSVFEDATWDSETYEEDINDLLEDYLKRSFNELSDDISLKEWEIRYLLENKDIDDFDETALSNKDTINTTWSTYIKNNNEYIEELAKEFAVNFNQALVNKYYLSICEEGQGSTSQYVNGVCNEFRNYCNMLTDSSGSPYINQLDILPKIYLFQAETKEIVEDLRTYYICNLTRYAIFYLGIMGACDVVDYESYVSLYNNTIEKIVNYFDSFLVLDANGNVVDNYCYVVGSPIEYENAHFNQTIKVYHEQYENKMFGIDYEVYNGYSSTPWTFSESNNNIVGNQDMLKISALYKHLREDGQSLNTYLQMNIYGEVKHKDEYTNWIITNFQGSKKFVLSEKIMMNVHGIGRNTYFVNVFSKYINDDSNKDIDDAGFVIHDAAVADTFDLNTLKNTTGKQILTRALFAEHSSGWFKDEMAVCAPRILVEDYSDTKTKEEDGHRYYTFEFGGDYYGYFVIKKTNSLSEETRNTYVDYNNLNDASSLNIDNTTKYYEQNDKDRSYIMYYDENNYLNNELSSEEVLNGFVSFVNNEKLINSLEAKNDNIVSQINDIDVFKDGYYDAELSDETINKIVEEIRTSINNNKDNVSKDALSSLIKLPSNNKEFNVVISMIYLPIFKIDKDDDNYHFSVTNAYVLRPYLVWNDGDSYIEISDSIIQKLGITFTAKIPALNKEDGMNRANISHYENKYNLQDPLETLTGKVVGDYIEFKTKSFSPFIVDSYYKEKSYSPVATGIE